MNDSVDFCCGAFSADNVLVEVWWFDGAYAVNAVSNEIFNIAIGCVELLVPHMMTDGQEHVTDACVQEFHGIPCGMAFTERIGAEAVNVYFFAFDDARGNNVVGPGILDRISL